MRFHFLGGRIVIPVLQPSLVQTDGSFRKGVGRIAVLLHHDSRVFSKVATIPQIRDSYEAEWASVYNGILFSLHHNAHSIHLENDNFGVITNLLSNSSSKTKKQYVNYYRNAIVDIVHKSDYVGIRWIPRSKNRADDLFRSNKLSS